MNKKMLMDLIDTSGGDRRVWKGKPKTTEQMYMEKI